MTQCHKLTLFILEICSHGIYLLFSFTGITDFSYVSTYNQRLFIIVLGNYESHLDEIHGRKCKEWPILDEIRMGRNALLGDCINHISKMRYICE